MVNLAKTRKTCNCKFFYFFIRVVIGVGNWGQVFCLAIEICFRIYRISYCTTKLWGSGYKPEPAVIFICVISEIVRLSAHDEVCGSKLFYSSEVLLRYSLAALAIFG